jgi:hypothetical protein
MLVCLGESPTTPIFKTVSFQCASASRNRRMAPTKSRSGGFIVTLSLLVEFSRPARFTKLDLRSYTSPKTVELTTEGRLMSAVRFEDEIRWDGNSLSIWATVNGSRIFCEIPRSTIHEVPLFSDAISREIARDRAEIFDRLRSTVVAKISRTRESSIRIHPSDIS